jgi:hypothetical protein
LDVRYIDEDGEPPSQVENRDLTTAAEAARK